MKMGRFSSVILLTLLFILATCAKEQVTDNQKETNKSAIVEDEVLIEDLMEELFDEVEYDNWWLDGFKTGRENNSCVTITADPEERGVFPKTITLDYGRGCESKNGHVRKGRISIEISASPRTDDWEKKITFTRFSIDDKVFKGGKVVSYTKEGRRGLPTWTTQSRIQIALDEETSIQRTSERTRTQTAGADTPLRPMDDTFVMTGSTTGTNRDGKGYKTTITTPLEISKDCRWIRKGVVLFQVRGKSDATLDYGEGRCDNIATYTQDGESKEIRIRK